MNNIIPAIPLLINLVKTTSHEEILLNTCWALTYLSQENDTVSQKLVEQHHLTNKFVTFLSNPNTPITYVALRILGNFVLSGFFKEVIDAGVLQYTESLYKNQDKDIRNETYYFLSLIAESGSESIDMLLNSSTSDLQMICNTMQNAVLNERMEAIWVIFNVAKHGTDEQLKSLVGLGAIQALCYNLNVPDVRFTLLVLDSIENILLVGDRLALDFKVLFEECGGRESIESMLTAENDIVYRKANAIFEEFFEESGTSTEEWEEDWR
jgi:importin subunit alpha-1